MKRKKKKKDGFFFCQRLEPRHIKRPFYKILCSIKYIDIFLTYGDFDWHNQTPLSPTQEKKKKKKRRPFYSADDGCPLSIIRMYKWSTARLWLYCFIILQLKRNWDTREYRYWANLQWLSFLLGYLWWFFSVFLSFSSSPMPSQAQVRYKFFLFN